MNTEQMIKRAELKSVIKKCFMDMYIVARADMKKHFKADKIQGKQWDFARSLVFLADVAKNLDKHFAPEYTNADWDKRTKDYMNNSSLAAQDVKEHGYKYVFEVTKGCYAYGPGGIVCETVKPCFQDNGLWNFCEQVQNYYYQDVDKNVYCSKRDIELYAKKLAQWANVAQSKSCVSRKLKEFVFGGYQRQYV
ncbi:MAG: hypothetical protein IKM94_05135 [Alphaproteobacteria bacterium]|nr:hypothetical protein [Alphaproteobacteria bacterium]